MKIKTNFSIHSVVLRGALAVTFLTLFSAFSIEAQVVDLTVTGSDGTAVTSYRWLIEEDATHNIVPDETCLNGNFAECLSVDFHRSYMPVIAEGHVTNGTADAAMPDLDVNKRYYISVLPDADYTIGGIQVAAGQTTASVTVTPATVPTAQIRIFVHNDNSPINNQPDTPQEQGLAGFRILLEDAGGRYGASGQQIVNDVFGNPLGTTYNPDGSVLSMGDGNVYTNENGIALLKNLAPAKYGIQAVPPAGSGWVQTATIEGKKIVDAWVKANEPPYFAEFGPPGPHVFIGFVQEFTDASVLTGGASITGQVRSIHNSRPPNFAFYTGAEVPGCWVGLNEMIGGLAGKGLYAAPCDANSNFTIPNVPAGNYQLAVWDKNQDYIFATKAVTVTADATGIPQDINLLDVPIFAWFARLEQYVFFDANENGFWDEGEVPLPEQGTGIRWRDGTIYQEFPTDLTGAAPYDEVFPFFSWLVAEVNFSRFKATGATIRVDDGGPVAAGEVMNPQPQSENGGAGFRTETGPVLTQAFQGFLGLTNIIEWGKTNYARGENGGISGIVFYAVTRAENDPKLAGAELWEPGIPRIQLALYEDSDRNGVIDDLNGDAVETISDVDNYPFGWMDGTSATPGAEDFDYNGNGAFDAGDAIQVTTTDSWDDNLPTGCQGEVFVADGTYPVDCYDGLRNFNQVRPGVFDGGYAFGSHFPGGIDSGSAEVDGIPSSRGMYIVGTGEHPVYKTVKEEDRNVDFGDEFIVAPNLLPANCVGNQHTVANDFTLFPLVDETGTPVQPYLAGTDTPLCDRKQVRLANGQNAAADFFMFTDVPVSGHIVGFILNDLANEFDPNSPQFGEKQSPPFIPVSIRDWQGNVIGRTYSDRWGRFNALVPSTYTNNLPSSSGISPSMLTTCMNDPGPIPGPNGTMITDPNFQRQYSQFCYTFQYMPGVTTYLDTPVLPIAAFAGPDQFPLDCEFPDGTPVIWSVQGPAYAGPYVSNAGESITVVSAGSVAVSNPAFGAPGEAKTILRDFGFGNDTGTATINGVTVAVSSWSNDSITLAIPASGQLQITRSNGTQSKTGITVTVGGPVISVVPGGSIQAAVDLASRNTTIIVPPGTYNESVIMWKPVKLQGSGASTIINAANFPAEKLLNWNNDVEALVNSNSVDLLPAQELGFGLPEPVTLFTEAGAGIIVLAKQSGPNRFRRVQGVPNARIDGISITGADNGGGIMVNGYARFLEISNNRIFSNYGVYGGGIRLGHPTLTADNLEYEDSVNDRINIHDNYVAVNGGGNSFGGGISLNHGADRYAVTSNYICGNFTAGSGGGIGHYGRNNRGLIANNSILFNQSFNQGSPVSGGGIYVGGGAGINGQLTAGSGHVVIDSNLIQGNNSGAGDGGGIRLANVNGQDAAGNRGQWSRIRVLNNMIVNNVAGFAGGGISLQDTARLDIINNTIANNDSTATSGDAFCNSITGLCDPNTSSPRIAGIVSYSHTSGLANLIAAGPLSNGAKNRYGFFSNPQRLQNNIIWQNRSFYFAIDASVNPPVYGLIPDINGGGAPVFDDLGVVGVARSLDPRNSILTDTTGYHGSNDSVNPEFIMPYFNGDRGQTLQQLELTTSIAVQPAFDEGGNFIDIRFGPLTPTGDYHIGGGAAVNAGNDNMLNFLVTPTDIDGEPRLQGPQIDIGADEL